MQKRIHKNYTKKSQRICKKFKSVNKDALKDTAYKSQEKSL
jgi:hypothetical protein